MSSLNFKNIVGNAPVDVKCPICTSKITITLNKVGTTIICPSCKSTIKLEKGNGFNNSSNSIDKSLRKLDKTLKKFGK